MYSGQFESRFTLSRLLQLILHYHRTFSSSSWSSRSPLSIPSSADDSQTHCKSSLRGMIRNVCPVSSQDHGIFAEIFRSTLVWRYWVFFFFFLVDENSENVLAVRRLERGGSALEQMCSKSAHPSTHPDFTWVLTRLVRIAWTVTSHGHRPVGGFLPEDTPSRGPPPPLLLGGGGGSPGRIGYLTQNSPDFPGGTPPVTPVSSVTCRCFQLTHQETQPLAAGIGWFVTETPKLWPTNKSKMTTLSSLFRTVIVQHSGCPTSTGKGAET